jgi:predicted PurR-regulated permease PerM
MNDTLLKLLIVMLTIATIFTIMGFVVGYNSPQMQNIFNQINQTQGYAVNMTNAFNNTNNYFNENNTGWLAPIENVLAFIGNFLYKTGIFIWNFLLIITSIFAITLTSIAVVFSIFNTSGLGSLSYIASLIYGTSLGIVIIVIVIYFINFFRGRNNV